MSLTQTVCNSDYLSGTIIRVLGKELSPSALGVRIMADPTAFYREVGQNVRRKREQLGLTQEALASQVALTRTSITNIEKGRQKLLLHTLVDIAHALGVEPALLLPTIIDGSKERLDAKLKEYTTSQQDWIKTTIESSGAA
jgi:transcriptional regulator with XRE-family HTH domain